MIETNGPANIIMLLEDLLDNNQIDLETYTSLKTNAERTIKYMKLLDNKNLVNWHDVK